MKKISAIRQELQSKPNQSSMILSPNEQNQIKGGLLLYCEEKRRTVGKISYTSRQWKIANDGKLWVNVKM